MGRIRDKDKQREASAKHYAANKAAMVERAAVAKKVNRERLRSVILEHLMQNPCVDCGEADPVVLDFDHRGDKEFNLGNSVRASYSVSRVLAEIDKCDVRCANCHRRKTYRERGFSCKG